MIRNKVVWDKHYYSNRFTVRNIFLLRYSRLRLMCTFKQVHNHVLFCTRLYRSEVVCCTKCERLL